jgi:RND family efflux transporter MFP subunit
MYIHKPSAKLLIYCILLAMASGCRGGAHTSGEEDREAALEPVPVRVTPAQLRSMAQVIVGLGSCEPLLNKTATLTPVVEGRVLEILAKPGERVKAYQPIVQLDKRVAEANLKEKKTTREGLEASLRLLKALPRPEEQKLLQLAIDDTKVSVQKAESVVERLKPLLQRTEISQQQMFEAKLALEQARVQQQKAEMALTVAMLGARRDAVDEAQAHIAAAAAAEASIGEQVDLHSIRSPIGGILDKITCRLGQTLTVGTPIGEIVDSRKLHALVWLPTSDARLVHAGQSARVTLNDSAKGRAVAKTAEPESEELTGSVDFVGQVVDPQTGNVPVRVLVDNPKERLGLGQMVTVAITVNQRPDVLAVPATAITDLGEGPLLSVVRQEKASLLYPQLGLKDKGWVEVIGIDLKPGEPVVIEGNYNLPDDTPVIPKQGDAKP